MKPRYFMYIAISVVCVLSIGVGIYAQLTKNSNPSASGNIIIGGNTHFNPPSEEEKDQETIKQEFNQLFTNEIKTAHFDTTTIAKLDESKEIVYSAYTMKEKKEDKYEVNINLPVVNMKGQVAQEFNTITQNVFANKATEVLTNTKEYTIYQVDYIGYINDDILSLVIRSSLKEGNNPQRVIVQTYNYNLKTNQKVGIEDILLKEQYRKDDLNQKIKEVIEEANVQAEALKSSGYTVYTRDLTNKMYQIEEATTYFLGENGELYIVYAYGNQNFTSEMDIIIF